MAKVKYRMYSYIKSSMFYAESVVKTSEASHENLSHQRANPRADSSSPQKVQIPH